ncbi:MAG: hypothetical protein N3A69_09675, partial [Leptospiraceae bacterium]|nr:hypothetical protein [Leptospiraceae bacterium]
FRQPTDYEKTLFEVIREYNFSFYYESIDKVVEEESFNIQIQKNKEEIKNFFQDLLKGKLTGSSSMDIALELFEWILTGFQEEELTKNILELFLNFQIPVNTEHIVRIQKKYSQLLEQENNRNS